MGVGKICASEHLDVADGSNNIRESQVVLNVYDLTPFNSYTYWFGFGIFHSGIEVHGMEYGYGAHEFSASGVFEVEPKSCPGFIYRCSVSLGRITMPSNEFRSLVEKMAGEYHGDTYHLVSKNCNHFTNDMSKRLTGKQIPGWVNRLAHVGSVCSCLLPESLQVTTVKQLPEYHECSDEEESFSSMTPNEHAEMEDELESSDQAKHLLSSSSGVVEVSFIKESSSSR